MFKSKWVLLSTQDCDQFASNMSKEWAEKILNWFLLACSYDDLIIAKKHSHYSMCSVFLFSFFGVLSIDRSHKQWHNHMHLKWAYGWIFRCTGIFNIRNVFRLVHESIFALLIAIDVLLETFDSDWTVGRAQSTTTIKCHLAHVHKSMK